jgi:hypothetical protein
MQQNAQAKRKSAGYSVREEQPTHGQIVGPERVGVIDDETLVVVDHEERQEAEHAKEEVFWL